MDELLSIHNIITRNGWLLCCDRSYQQILSMLYQHFSYKLCGIFLINYVVMTVVHQLHTFNEHVDVVDYRY